MFIAFASSDALVWISLFRAALVIGFPAGLYFFFKGLRVYREYRFLSDTPEMPIRSIPIGLVKIHGKAQGSELVRAPVSGTECLFYKVDVETQHSRNSAFWLHVATDADGALFYLEDETGKVLVDAHGAQYDLIQSGRIETSEKHSPLDGYAVSAIRKWSRSRFAVLVRCLIHGRASFCRFTEYCILPGHWYDVTGTCVENPNSHDEHDRNLIAKGRNAATYLISWRSERGLKGTLRGRSVLYVFGGAALSIACLILILGQLAQFGLV
jgi:hypothetical protein